MATAPQQAAWWDPSHGEDTDVVAHTPDPTKYHYPDGRQNTRMRSGVKGVIIPRSTRHGGSQGFDATKPGVVHVDPEAPDGGAIVDLQQMSAASVERSVKMTRHPHEAFYAMAGKPPVYPGQQPQPQPEPHNPAASSIVPQTEEPEMSPVQPPSLSAADQGAQPSQMTNVPDSPHIASLTPPQQPQSTFQNVPAAQPPPPQPAWQPPAQPYQPVAQVDPMTQMMQMMQGLVGRMDQIEANGHHKQAAEHVQAPDGLQVPLPPVSHPQRPPEPSQAVQQPPVAPQPPPVASTPSQQDDWNLGMPWVTGPSPVKPQYQVIFKMKLGTISSFYHEVIQNGINLVLVYDTRHEATQQFMPPTNPGFTFEVEIPAMKESFTCSFGGQAFAVGKQDLMVLLIHQRPVSAATIPPPPPSVDLSIVQDEAALANMPHPGLQQAMASGGIQ